MLNIFFKSTIYSSLEKKINCLSIIKFYVVLKLYTDTIFKMLRDLIKKIYVFECSLHYSMETNTLFVASTTTNNKYQEAEKLWFKKLTTYSLII